MWKKAPIKVGNAMVTEVHDNPLGRQGGVGIVKVPGPSNKQTPALSSAAETMPTAKPVNRISGPSSVIASTVARQPVSATPRAFKTAGPSSGSTFGSKPLTPAFSTTNLYYAKGAGEKMPSVPKVKGVPLYGNTNIGQSAKTVRKAIVGQPRSSQVIPPFVKSKSKPPIEVD